MKKALVAFLAFIHLAVPIHAQNGNLAWAKKAGGNFFDEPNAIAVDSSGNVYTAGYFRNTATFGPGEANQTIIPAFGQDVFIAKHSAAGSLLWVRQGKSQMGLGMGVGVDTNGNSYVFGYFSNLLIFADGQTNQVTLSALANDLFLAKYDPEGNFLWAKKAGGSFSEYAAGLAVDPAGNSFITGRYGSNPLIFAPGETNETSLPSLNGSNGEDIFLAKYDANGSFVWAKSAGGPNGNRGMGVALDAAGNIYVAGRWSGTSTFGLGEPNETVLRGPIGNTNDEIFVAKFAPNGNLVWVRSGLGQAEHDQGNAIAVDPAGNSVATGTYRAFPPFGGQLNQTQLDEGASPDIFIVRHDTDGNRQWVKYAVGPAEEVALGVAMDPLGNAYITGHGNFSIFGAEEPGQTNINGLGSPEVFLAKYDTNGLVQWVRQAGGNGDDRGQAIAYGDRAIHVAGRFGQTAIFGRDEPNQTSLTFGGAFDVFIAKYIVMPATTNTIVPASFTGIDLLPNRRPRFTITGTVGHTYTLQRASTLAPANWNIVGTATINQQSVATFEDTDPALALPAFYRTASE